MYFEKIKGSREMNMSRRNLRSGHEISNRNKNKPFVLIAKTTKGYPISFMSNKPIWHYRSPNKDEFLKAKKELNEK